MARPEVEAFVLHETRRGAPDSPDELAYRRGFEIEPAQPGRLQLGIGLAHRHRGERVARHVVATETEQVFDARQRRLVLQRLRVR